MMRSAFARAMLVATMAAGAAVSLDASLIVPTDLPTLSAEATRIVHARVTEVRGIVRPGARRVDSYVVLAIADSLKGGADRTMVIRTLGGVSGRYRTVVPGSPVFAPGDEAVIFLGKGAVPYPIGLSHGVFRVQRGRVLPPPMLIDPAQTMLVRRGDGARVPIPVDQFTALVRGLAARRVE